MGRRVREVLEQQLREQEVAQVVDAELQLEPVVCDRAPCRRVARRVADGGGRRGGRGGGARVALLLHL